jgi:hypothetical protein
MLSQLHSIFTTHTQIERELSKLVSAGVIRKILLRGSSDGGGQVSGAGGDTGLILSDKYQTVLWKEHDPHSKFSEWLSGPGQTAVSVSKDDLSNLGISDEEIQRLIETGFLTLEYSMKTIAYTLSVPGIGNFVKNLRGGRRKLLRVLKRQTYKEMLEKVRRCIDELTIDFDGSEDEG